MDPSKKYQVNTWVGDTLYTMLDDLSKKRQITPADVAVLTPLIQMYQTIKIEDLYDALNGLWQALVDGSALVHIRPPSNGLNVNVELEEPPKPKNVRKPTKGGE